MQAYEAYVENGNVYPVGEIMNTSKRMRAIITVLDETTTSIKEQRQPLVDNITIASEKSLSKEWLLPEEDVAWADL